MLSLTTGDSVSGQEKGFKSQSIPPVFIREEKVRFKTCRYYALLFIFLLDMAFYFISVICTHERSPNRGSQILDPIEYLHVVTNENKTKGKKGSQSETQESSFTEDGRQRKAQRHCAASSATSQTASDPTGRLFTGQNTNGFLVYRLQLISLFSNIYIYLKYVHSFQTRESNYIFYKL